MVTSNLVRQQGTFYLTFQSVSFSVVFSPLKNVLLKHIYYHSFLLEVCFLAPPPTPPTPLFFFGFIINVWSHLEQLEPRQWQHSTFCTTKPDQTTSKLTSCWGCHFTSLLCKIVEINDCLYGMYSLYIHLISSSFFHPLCIFIGFTAKKEQETREQFIGIHQSELWIHTRAWFGAQTVIVINIYLYYKCLETAYYGSHF